MKCPNCGGEVSVNDVKCPYCGTPNPEGIHFQENVRKRKRFNEYLREKIREQMRIPLAHRVLNLSTFFLILLLLLQSLVSFCVYLIGEEHALAGLFRPKDYETQMVQMYENGEFGQLDAFMDRYSIENTDYPEYTQMCILNYQYEKFLECAMNCMQAMEQGQVPREYDLDYVIEYTECLLNPDIPAYPDIYPENQEILTGYQQEAVLYLNGILKLPLEEIQLLYPEPEERYHSNYDEIHQLQDHARELLKKEGYTDESEY